MGICGLYTLAKKEQTSVKLDIDIYLSFLSDNAGSAPGPPSASSNPSCGKVLGTAGMSG